MKNLYDVYTTELPGIEQPERKSNSGRKPLFARAMSDAERKRRQRAKQKEDSESTSNPVNIDCRACPSGGIDG